MEDFFLAIDSIKNSQNDDIRLRKSQVGVQKNQNFVSQQKIENIKGSNKKKSLTQELLDMLRIEGKERLGMKGIKGILLYGAPGTGKSYSVQQINSLVQHQTQEINQDSQLIATQHYPIFLVSPSRLFSRYIGDSELYLRTLFQQAEKMAPSIIFFDEIDTLIGKRGFSFHFI